VVPDNPIIPFPRRRSVPWSRHLAGHVRVLDAAFAKAYGGQLKIAWMEVHAARKLQQFDNGARRDGPVPSVSIWFIKGPLTTPVGGGIRSRMWRSVQIPTCSSSASGPLVQGVAVAGDTPEVDHGDLPR